MTTTNQVKGLPKATFLLRALQKGISLSVKAPCLQAKALKYLRWAFNNLEALHQPGRERELLKAQLMFLSLRRDPILSSKFFDFPEVKKDLSKARDFLKGLEAQHEKESAQKVTTGEILVDAKYIWLNAYYAEMECNLLDLNNTSKVLLMGGGAMPMTAVVYSRRFGANCDCLDIDNSANGLAKQVIAKTGLAHKIKVMAGNAIDFPLAGYDLIVVTNHCEPKTNVFQHILANADKGVKVIFRNPVGLGKLFYEEVLPQQYQGFTVLKKEAGGLLTASESVVLGKEKGGYI